MPRRSRGLPNLPRSALLWSAILYVKQCADDNVDLVMLAHHPAAWKAQHSFSPPLASHMLLSLFRSHINTHTHIYSVSVRGPHVCQSFIQTRLRLLHATIITRWTWGKHIKPAFSLANCAPSSETWRWRGRKKIWQAE